MGKQRLSLIIIRQFKVAVEKMRLLLALYRQVHSSMGRRTSSKLLQRWRSFTNVGSESSRRGRTRSYYYGWDEEDDEDDDINERAENFIANFRHQLRLERQMELRCYSSSGFEDDY